MYTRVMWWTVVAVVVVAVTGEPQAHPHSKSSLYTQQYIHECSEWRCSTHDGTWQHQCTWPLARALFFCPTTRAFCCAPWHSRPPRPCKRRGGRCVGGAAECEGGLALPQYCFGRLPLCCFRKHENVNITCPGKSVTISPDLHLRGKSGLLSSPGFPHFYPKDIHVSTHISVPESHVVKLEFLEFDLESDDYCSHDYLEVVEEGGRGLTCDGRTRFCGTRPPGSLTSTTSRVTITLHTDYSVEHSGVRLCYTAIHKHQLQSHHQGQQQQNQGHQKPQNQGQQQAQNQGQQQPQNQGQQQQNQGHQQPQNQGQQQPQNQGHQPQNQGHPQPQNQGQQQPQNQGQQQPQNQGQQQPQNQGQQHQNQGQQQPQNQGQQQPQNREQQQPQNQRQQPENQGQQPQNQRQQSENQGQQPQNQRQQPENQGQQQPEYQGQQLENQGQQQPQNQGQQQPQNQGQQHPQNQGQQHPQNQGQQHPQNQGQQQPQNQGQQQP